MQKIWGKRVLLPDGWSDNTLIEIDAKGKINNIKKNVGIIDIFTWDFSKKELY